MHTIKNQLFILCSMLLLFGCSRNSGVQNKKINDNINRVVTIEKNYYADGDIIYKNQKYKVEKVLNAGFGIEGVNSTYLEEITLFMNGFVSPGKYAQFIGVEPINSDDMYYQIIDRNTLVVTYIQYEKVYKLRRKGTGKGAPLERRK